MKELWQPKDMSEKGPPLVITHNPKCPQIVVKLKQDFKTNDHVIVNGSFAAFNFHICLDSSVSVEYFLFVNDLAWFLYLVLRSSAATPMYFTGLLSSVETWYTAWYTTL